MNARLPIAELRVHSLDDFRRLFRIEPGSTSTPGWAPMFGAIGAQGWAGIPIVAVPDRLEVGAVEAADQAGRIIWSYRTAR